LNNVRIVVADDHAVVRAGIANALRALANVKIVGEANDGRTLQTILDRTRPDMLVTDVTMPNFDPIQTISQIRASFPDLKILVVSAYDDDMYVQGMLHAGVNGYHLKDQPLRDLRIAVERVLAGELWVCSPLVEKLVHGHGTPTQPMPLTSRQRDMLGLLIEGLDNHGIARRSGLSVKTIENHLTRLYRQIDVQSRLEAVNYYLQHPDILGGMKMPPNSTAGSNTPDSNCPVILIVDDNIRYSAQMRRMVAKNFPSALVYEADSIAEALRMVESYKPQLIFTDVVLADENGIDFARQVKSLAPSTRVVLMSA
jgi:DNA-binding NarL/FixJ family response regulator